MSESVSTRTKTLTDTTDTESINNPLLGDRWSNIISYRQLVVSPSIGIIQLFWHPYVHDLTKLLPFLFLYNVFSIFVGYPMSYLELALGVVTKKGVLSCWDLAPMARGVGIAMLGVCVFTALSLSTVAAWCLAMLVHSCHAFLPWLHCAAAAAPPCAARHRYLVEGTETPAQSFFFNLVLNLKRDGVASGLGTIVWELSVYFIISWILIYLVAIKRIYSYSKLVLFKDVLAYFVLICCAVGVPRLAGANAMVSNADWGVLVQDVQIWRRALEYALVESTVSQGSLVMLGAYCPKQQHSLMRTALFAFMASKSTSLVAALVLGATHGALQHDYKENATRIWQGPSASIILWSEFVARIPGSQFWSCLVFFTLFVLAVSSTALVVQTIMSTLTGRAMRKIAWAFLVSMCTLFCFIGVLTLCTQGGLYVLNLIQTWQDVYRVLTKGGLYVLSLTLSWPALMTRVPIAATMGMVVTYTYGQTTFCEDVFFAVGEYPCVFFRVCWGVAPFFLLLTFFMGMDWQSNDAIPGIIFVVPLLLPIIVIMCFYLVFKCRIRNIVATEK